SRLAKITDAGGSSPFLTSTRSESPSPSRSARTDPDVLPAGVSNSRGLYDSPPRRTRSGLGPSAPRTAYSPVGRSANVPTTRSGGAAPFRSPQAAACPYMPVSGSTSPYASVTSSNAISPEPGSTGADQQTRPDDWLSGTS